MHRYAFFDLDQTIYDGYSLSESLYFFAENNICEKNIANKVRTLEDQYAKNEIDFHQISYKLIDLYAEVIKGQHIEEFKKNILQFIGTKKVFFDYVPKVFKFLKDNSFEIYIISGTIQPIIEVFGSILEVHKSFGSSVAIKGSTFQNRITNYLVFENKLALVHRVLGHLPKNSIKIGFGDSTGDVEMLLHCQKAFLINPHQKEMFELAKKNNWTVTKDPEVIVKEIKKVLKK